MVIPSKKMLGCPDTVRLLVCLLFCEALVTFVRPDSKAADELWAACGIRAMDQKYPLMCLCEGEDGDGSAGKVLKAVMEPTVEQIADMTRVSAPVLQRYLEAQGLEMFTVTTRLASIAR